MNSVMTSLSHNEMQQLEVTSFKRLLNVAARPGVQRDSAPGPGSSQSLESLESLESLVLDAEHWVHQLIVDVH